MLSSAHSAPLTPCAYWPDLLCSLLLTADSMVSLPGTVAGGISVLSCGLMGCGQWAQAPAGTWSVGVWEAWSVECGVWRCGAGSVEWWSVECGVWSVECVVWSVEWGV